MSIKSIEDLILADKPRIEKVIVPEWQSEVFVRSITAAQRDRFESESFALGSNSVDRMANARARLCVLAICDENGNRILKDSDAVRLGESQAGALDRIYSVAARLAGMDSDGLDRAEKN